MTSQSFFAIQMTSNTTPSPFVVSASSEIAGSYDAWHAFDGGTQTGAYYLADWLTNAHATGWIQIDLGAANALPVTCYKMMSSINGTSYNPTAWSLLGSNDGTFATYTVLDTQSGVTFLSNTASTQIYTFSNTTVFRYIRWNFTANNGAGYLGLNEILLGYTTPGASGGGVPLIGEGLVF